MLLQSDPPAAMTSQCASTIVQATGGVSTMLASVTLATMAMTAASVSDVSLYAAHAR